MDNGPGVNNGLEDGLNQALASYSKAEPLHGLDERILARVRTEGRSLRPLSLTWRLTLVGLGLAMVISVWFGARGWFGTRIETPKAVAGRGEKAGELTGVASPRLPTDRMVDGVQARRVRRGRRAVVPSRPRLSSEEVLLARFVAADPAGAAKEFASLREFTDRDLAVAPLVVEPIKIKSLEEAER